MGGFPQVAPLSLNNGHPPTEEPQQNNPGNSEDAATPGPETPADGTQAEPVQLAFSFALTPQPDGQKTPWLKRVRLEGLSDYLDILEGLLANPPRWETKYWEQNKNRKREWAKKAHYIAWACSPALSRQPRTQKELAERLGVTTQAIWKWKTENPEMIELIQELTLKPLEAALADVYRVTIDQARDPNSSTQARKLYFEALAEARAARQPIAPQQVNQLLQVIFSNLNWDSLPQEAVERIAAGENPLAVLVSGTQINGGE